MYYHENNTDYITLRTKQPITAVYGGKSLWADCGPRKTEVRKIRLFIEGVDLSIRKKPWSTATLGQQLYVGIHAFIPKRMWDTSKYGLIYTDDRWEREFRAGLKLSFPVLKAIQSVGYTEQGQQGDDYVSLDGSICGMKKMRDFADAIEAGDILDDMLAEADEEEERGFK